MTWDALNQTGQQYGAPDIDYDRFAARWESDPIIKKLVDRFKYEIPGARFTPAVKLGRWDGKVSFFGLGGNTYLALVGQILPVLEDAGVYVELEDQRTPHNFEFKLIDQNYFLL